MIYLDPKGIYDEYKSGINFKSSIGEKGLFEQIDINERFFVGDQWYGAKCGNRRPLVRHNVIKRIGEFKMSQVLSSTFDVNYGVGGVSRNFDAIKSKNLKQVMSNIKNENSLTEEEINAVSSALGKYRTMTAKRMFFDNLCAKALKNAYISGTGIIYTYWDGDIATGISKKGAQVKGDIKCEVLNVKNVYFANPYESSVEKQPYIIISSIKDVDDVIHEAIKYGSDEYNLRNIKPSRGNKILVLTKLFKETDQFGKTTVKCIKVTDGAVIRPTFDTKLRRYPIAVFKWEERDNLIYGDSEITYLVPNQIAINRMITANVWSAVTMGMPMMVVNGDTVNEEITNDPGQIIKIFGSNEDVAGAIKYVTPPDVTKNFGESVNNLIENTLMQCGANEVALGDSRADNMGALTIMRNAAVLPLALIKNRYSSFIENISLIWADFWITQYGDREICISDEKGVWYLPFNAERYKDLYFVCNLEQKKADAIDDDKKTDLLIRLYEKGIISKEQLFLGLPKGLVEGVDSEVEERSKDK